MMVGIISTMADTNRAATCVWVMQEISSPNARDTKMNNRDTPNRAGFRLLVRRAQRRKAAGWSSGSGGKARNRELPSTE